MITVTDTLCLPAVCASRTVVQDACIAVMFHFLQLQVVYLID